MTTTDDDRAPTPTGLVLVEGTGGGKTWAAPGTPFRTMLEAEHFLVRWFQGWALLVDGLDPFARDHPVWTAGAWGLSYFLEGLPYEARNLIGHSHAVNVILLAIALGKIPIRRLVTICSPVRGDMQAVADEAAPRIGRWRAIHATGGDPVQRLGELGGGHVGALTWRQAHETLAIPDIKHGLLFTPAFLELWRLDGINDFLRAEQGPRPPATTTTAEAAAPPQKGT